MGPAYHRLVRKQQQQQQQHQQFDFVLLMVVAISMKSCHCTPLEFDEFSSQSFLPHVLQVDYRIERKVAIYYNLTATEGFPGKILFSVFVRKLPPALDSDGDHRHKQQQSESMLKYHNLDFCKMMETMRNLTTENFHSRVLLQTTFITSCPLTRGVYYIRNGTVDDEVVPLTFPTGHYWIQFELVQLFEDVTKLFNVRARFHYVSRWAALIR